VSRRDALQEVEPRERDEGARRRGRVRDRFAERGALRIGHDDDALAFAHPQRRVSQHFGGVRELGGRDGH